MPAATARPWGASGHTRTRTVGLILVALVHVALVAALVEGFRRHATPTQPPLTLVVIDDTIRREPPKVDPIPAPKLPESPLTPRLVDIPEVPVVAPVAPNTAPVTTTTQVATATGSTEPPMASGGSEGTITPPQPAIKEPVAPGMVCTAMATPEMPSVSWTGEAVFRVVADVRTGRVVATEIRALQGAMDTRTRRAFTNAIDTVLKQRYVCPGDHRFQQDFSFRVD